MRLLICGDRNWTDADAIVKAIDKYKPSVVIEGEARGADRLARLAAVAVGIEVLQFPADWNRHGKAAGPIRNQQMLDEGRPDLVLAFHNDIRNSKGTADMVCRSRRAFIKAIVITQVD